MGAFSNNKRRGLASSAGQVLVTDDNERPGSNMEDVEPPNLMLSASANKSVAGSSEQDDSKKTRKISKNSKSHNSRQKELEKTTSAYDTTGLAATDGSISLPAINDRSQMGLQKFIDQYSATDKSGKQ